VKTLPNLKKKYLDEVTGLMRTNFGYSNAMEIPKMVKIVVNAGLGEAIQNHKILETVSKELAQITGQKPVITKARKSIAGFKLRKGMSIGCVVTLRGDRMYEFMERLIVTALPRVRDFRGVPSRSFDGRGNYTLGIQEQLIFPEIDYDKVDRVSGFSITFVTSAKSDEEARKLLELMGIPFRN
jgi:large subunit ribosomal protein L5